MKNTQVSKPMVGKGFHDQAQKVIFYAAVNLALRNGFSFYKVEYKGDLPKLLIDYHDEIYEGTSEAAPKKRIREQRIQKRKKRRNNG